MWATGKRRNLGHTSQLVWYGQCNLRSTHYQLDRNQLLSACHVHWIHGQASIDSKDSTFLKICSEDHLSIFYNWCCWRIDSIWKGIWIWDDLGYCKNIRCLQVPRGIYFHEMEEGGNCWSGNYPSLETVLELFVVQRFLICRKYYNQFLLTIYSLSIIYSWYEFNVNC